MGNGRASVFLCLMAIAFACSGEDASSIKTDEVLELIRDGTDDEASKAAEEVGRLKDVPVALIEGLVLIVRRNPERRRLAAKTIERIGASAVPVLVAAVRVAEEPFEKLSVVASIGAQQQSQDVPEVGAVMRELADENWRTRLKAMARARRLPAEEYAKLVPAVSTLLSDKNRLVVVGAVGTLRHFGPSAASEAGKIASLLEHNDKGVCLFSAEALLAVNSGHEKCAAAISILIAELRNVAPHNRQEHAARVLCNSPKLTMLPLLNKLLEISVLKPPEDSVPVLPEPRE